jgi:hypothetical protein
MDETMYWARVQRVFNMMDIQTTLMTNSQVDVAVERLKSHEDISILVFLEELKKIMKSKKLFVEYLKLMWAQLLVQYVLLLVSMFFWIESPLEIVGICFLISTWFMWCTLVDVTTCFIGQIHEDLACV